MQFEVSMLELHPQILENHGKRQFAVLPYDEFIALQEILADAQDLIDLREAKKAEGEAETMSLDGLKALLGL